MMDLMKSDTSKYDWMIHAKYGIGNPTHDIIKEVPCTIVANQEALASETMFKTVPILLASEVCSISLGFITISLGLFFDSKEWNFLGATQNTKKQWFSNWLPSLILDCFLALLLGFTSGAFIEIFTAFDYKNGSDNLKNVCKKYSSPKLLSEAVLTTVIIGIVAIYKLAYAEEQYQILFGKTVNLKTVIMFVFTALIFLQTTTYIAMFSNFRYNL